MLFDVLEEHFEELAFAYFEHVRLSQALDATTDDHAAATNNVWAHVDGLVLDAPTTWGAFGDRVTSGPTEEAFAATLLALESGVADIVSDLIAKATTAPPVGLRGVTAAVSISRSPAVAEVLQTLAAADAPARTAAIRASANRGEPLEPAVEAGLSSSDPGEISAALRALSPEAATAHRRRVEEHLDSGHETVAAAALEAYASYAPDRARERCLAALDSKGAVRRAAATLLGRVGQPQDREPLLLLATGSGDWLARRTAVLSIGRLTTSLDDARDLLELLGEPTLAGVATAALRHLIGEDCPVEPVDAPPPGDDPPDDDLQSLDLELPRYEPAPLAEWLSQRTAASDAAR